MIAIDPMARCSFDVFAPWASEIDRPRPNHRGKTDMRNGLVEKPAAAQRVHRCDLLKGRLIDLRRQRELHSLQNYGLRRSVHIRAMKLKPDRAGTGVSGQR